MISSLDDLKLVRVFQRRSHPDYVLPGLHLRLENLLENLGGVEVGLNWLKHNPITLATG